MSEIEHVLEYQLEYDPALDFTELERAEAYRELARYGTWKEGMWWHPGPAVGYDLLDALVIGMGFLVVDQRVSED